MDVETILYIVFFLIFIISSFFKSRKKERERRSVNDDFGPEPASSQPEKKEERTFQDILNEMTRGLEEEEYHEETPPIVREKPKPKLKDIEKEATKPMIPDEGIRAFGKSEIENELFKEGESSLYKLGEADITEGNLLGDLTEDGSTVNEIYEFDPREAFMLKILLDKRYE